MDESHDLRDFYADELRNKTKLLTIPAQSDSCFRFDIFHSVETKAASKCCVL